MTEVAQNDAAVAATTSATNKAGTPTVRAKRPNFNVIHADPLPITLYHGPPLLPNNPLSLLHHLYLYLFPPAPSHSVTYTGVFSPISMSVEVADPKAVLELWQRGFWGKGSLSRSEPTWLHREMRRLGDTEVGETSEEITRRRRDQRKEMKKERAKKEKEELGRVKEEEAKSKAEMNGNIVNEKPVVADPKVVVDLEEEINRLSNLASEPLQSSQHAADTGLPTPPLSISDDVEVDVTSTTSSIFTNTTPATLPISTPPTTSTPSSPPQLAKVVRFDVATTTKEATTQKKVNVKNQEHLQLALSEAFFLVYALGVLSVTTQTSSQPLTVPKILELFLRHSKFPPLPESSVSLNNLNPDNAFLINYVVYHHFRSLGWVVKSGVKFSVDFLLYKRGPVFSHAEFAILVIPCYSRWEGRDDVARKEWNWLHSITRVNSQVKKTVVLVYIDVPTAEEVKGWERERDGLKEVIARYTIREVALRRWIPGRNRD